MAEQKWEGNMECQETITRRKAEDKESIPSCTMEGVNYVLECWTCRREGTRRIYYGETSRSRYQRGVECLRGINEGKVPEESLNSKNEWGGDKPHLYWYPPQREWHRAVGKWRKARKADPAIGKS